MHLLKKMSSKNIAHEWTLIESEEIADCRVFKVERRRMKNATTGAPGDFFVVRNPDWVNVIPITESGEIVLIRQFRYGIDRITTEIPGGIVDAGETPEECAVRELAEETGYSSESLVSLGFSNPNPAIQDNRIHHFVAFGCAPTADSSFDEHESIELVLESAAGVDRLIDEGGISHSLVIAAFGKYEKWKLKNEN